MSAPVLPLHRKVLYAAVLSGALLALLAGGLELGLRLVGYGHAPEFFRRTTTPSGETIWRENRWALAPYFPGTLIRRPQSLRLPEKKASGTYRIFILGSSAAMGDPEPSFSLARVLDVMLRAAYPGRRFEVVNAAVTAINSHVVRGIAEDCARLEPDLFIIYEGNNEVIGPFGPTGVLAPFLRSERAIRAAVWFRQTRTGQLLSSLGQRHAAAGWGGMEMFIKQQVAEDDPHLQHVRANFLINLDAIIDSARNAGAAAVLCTVPTNQRNFAPFMSEQGHPDRDSAEALYQLGQKNLAAGKDDWARENLQYALDLDTLRFRTDRRLNQLVYSHGQDLNRVVDVAAALAQRSPHGIPGDEFFYDHVHLNLRGTYEMALALWPHFTTRINYRDPLTGPPATTLSYEDVSLRLGYNTYEQTMIALEMVNRFSKPPFTGQSDSAARSAIWKRRADAGQALLARPEATAALRELSHRALEISPDDWVLARNTGAMLVSRQLPAEALPLLERAAAWIEDDIDTLVALGRAQQALGQTEAAEFTFAKARRLEPRYPGLPAPRN